MLCCVQNQTKLTNKATFSLFVDGGLVAHNFVRGTRVQTPISLLPVIPTDKRICNEILGACPQNRGSMRDCIRPNFSERSHKSAARIGPNGRLFFYTCDEYHCDANSLWQEPNGLLLVVISCLSSIPIPSFMPGPQRATRVDRV